MTYLFPSTAPGQGDARRKDGRRLDSILVALRVPTPMTSVAHHTALHTRDTCKDKMPITHRLELLDKAHIASFGVQSALLSCRDL